MSIAAETGLWQLDAGSSTVALRNKTMWGLVTVKGTFGVVRGQGEVLPDGTVTGTLSLDAATLDTKNAKRDEHLRSADFLDVAQYPEIAFVVRSVERGRPDAAEIKGELTAHGITRPQAVTARLTEEAGALTLDAEFAVDRADFGVGGNQLGMMGARTTLVASLRFTHA
ncbi:YceI family protein [Streptomyces sp. NPDC058459]|uniref:YceI family protein n=1 Tax=Streptomyces sp. NPDC058459 TaxID=3346508 RepID=UPI0036582F6D